MIIGKITIRDKTNDKIILRVNNMTVTINKCEAVVVLLDPFYGGLESGVSIYRYSFDDLLDNIIDDDGEYIFEDDLRYICGIAKA